MKKFNEGLAKATATETTHKALAAIIVHGRGGKDAIREFREVSEHLYAKDFQINRSNLYFDLL